MGDLELLDDRQQAQLDSCFRLQGYACKDGKFPAYHLQNLGGNINRNKKRLNQLTKGDNTP